MKLIQRPQQPQQPSLALVDDEMSVSSEHSTVSVAQAPTKPVSRRRRRVSVHFDTRRNEYYASTTTSATTTASATDAQDSTWLSHTELKQCKQRTLALAKELYRADQTDDDDDNDERTYSRVLGAAYQACCRPAMSSCDNHDTVLDRATRQAWVTWMRVGVSRHGMERSAVREIHLDKRQRRRAVVQAVLDAQDSLAYRYSDAADDVLRHVSAAWTRPSRLFAREMAAVVAETL